MSYARSPQTGNDHDASSADGSLIVGRDHEQDQLHQYLSAALAGRGGLVLIGGEAGIGKTTLVEALAAIAHDHGAVVVTGGCYDLTTTPPYGPWRELADQLALLSTTGALPVVLRHGDVPINMSQDTLFADVRTFIGAVATARPLVLVLEDLHWADAASLELLRSVARVARRLPLLLVVTYRIDEIVPDHPLFLLLPLLVRESGAERIDLRQLGESDVREVVTRRFRLVDRDVDRLVQYLVDYTDGNPLYLSELLRTLEDEGILTTTQGNAVLGDLNTLVIPRLIRQVIIGRAARLDPATRKLLTIAAVIGQEVPLDVWSAVSDVAEDVLLTAVEQGMAAAFLTGTNNDLRVRFVHALIREALYESILPLRRRAWHRQIAETLEQAAHVSTDAVASHFQAAGDARTANWLIRAAEGAERSYAWTTAAARFEAVLPLLEADSNTQRLRGWVLLHLGRLLRYATPSASVGYLDEARRVANAVGDRALAALALAHAGMVRGFLWDTQRATVELEAGVTAQDALTPAEWADAYRLQRSLIDSLPGELDLDDPEDLEVATITSQQTGLLVRQLPLVTLRYHDAVALGEAYAARIEAVDTTALLHHTSTLEGASWIDTYTGIGESSAILGQVDAAVRACATAEALFHAAGHHASIIIMAAQCAWLIELPYQADDPVQRARWEAIADASEQHTEGIYRAGWSPGMTRLPILVLQGAWERAEQIATNMIAHQPAALAIMAEVALGTIALARGEYDEVLAIVGQRLPDGPASDPTRTAAIGVFHLTRLATSVALERAELETARAWLTTHDRWLDASGRILGRAEGQLLWARLDTLSGAWDHAEERANAALASASAPRQPVALLATHRLLGEIATRQHRLGEASQHLNTALRLSDACVAPFERAMTVLALAALRRAQGHRDAARTLASDAQTLCTSLRARPTLARVAAVLEQLDGPTDDRHPLGLTAREVDGLRLVAQGLTDAEVAEQLFVARRTVNTHLTSIYTKLGVSSRTAAARIAIEHGIS